MNNKVTIDLETGWGFMTTGIEKLKLILEDRAPGLKFDSAEYMHLYTTIYDMCTQKAPSDYSQQMYDRYRQAFVDYINAAVLPSINKKHGELKLKEVAWRWKNHKTMVRWLSKFFHYLDRYFIARRSLPSLNNSGVATFKDMVYESSKDVRDEMCSLIDQEREGERIDHSVMKDAKEVYIGVGLDNDMSFYVQDFEEEFLQKSREYYKKKASIWIVEDSCPDYMIKAEECLKKEKERVFNYLHSTTESKLLDAVLDELLTKVSSQLLEKENSGCAALLKDDKVEDLSRMYRLFSRIPDKGLDPVARTFKQHVTDEGLALVKQAEDAASNKSADKKDVAGSQEQNFVRKLIELHDKYLEYVNKCFANSSLFHKSLKEAFEAFCNKNIGACPTAELLATFCDNILRGSGGEKLSDEAIEELMEKAVKLLAFISDKDLFAEFYKKKLSKRLLGDKSFFEDYEKGVLTKLKQNYGAQFMSKMEGMMTDVIIAGENQNDFEQYNNDGSKYGLTGGVNFVVKVLTTGFWPSYKNSDINLPAEMVKCIEVFRDYYGTKTKHRKLTWVHSMGSCILHGKFDAKPIELIVSPYQACLLLLFNSSDRLSFQEIQVQLNLPEEDVRRLLHSLSCAKFKILTKDPNSKSISATDVFEFNSKFNDRLRKIRIPLPPLPEERKKVVEDVDKDRRYAIDAALVRIMKSRKVLGYQQLVMECVEQLSKMFKPDVKIIKKRIEDLITREYLERDTDNPNTFKYLA